MKRIALAALIAVAFGVPVTAGADHSSTHQVFTGAIELATPVGLTQNLDPCIPGGEHEGLDGQWFALAAGSAGKAANLTFPVGARPQLSDFDAYFFKADCTDTGYTAMASTANPEKGTVPADSAFVVVDYFLGPPGASFTLTIDAPAA